MLERLGKKTPKIIKKLQKIVGAIGSSSVIITSLTSIYDVLVIPNFVIYTIAIATVLNHILLELFTEDDNI